MDDLRRYLLRQANDRSDTPRICLNDFRFDGPPCAVCLNLDPRNPLSDGGRRISSDRVILQHVSSAYTESAKARCLFCALIRDAIAEPVVVTASTPSIAVELNAQEPQRIFFNDHLVGILSLYSGSKAVGPFRPCLSASAGSEQGIAYIKRCYQACVASHPECLLDTPTIPTRLIFLGENNSQIKLVEPAASEMVEYASLSHCWGQTTHTCMLKIETESSMKTSIPWNSLPATYQDAITVCRELRLQYVWIDSLCIRQDDREDWARQAERMADIYEDAHLVIAANCSSTPTYSFLSHKRPGGFDYKVLAWADGQPALCLELGRNRGLHNRLNTENDRDPLDNRGWAFQEQRLARRLFRFTTEETQWSCRAKSGCECSGQNGTPSAPVAQDQDIWTEWTNIVTEYSWRALSFRSDVFPALSGFAARFASNHNLEYIAGLWNRNLAEQLTWRRTIGRTVDGWLAPTFSWASINGTVTWAGVRRPEIIKDYVVQISAQCTLKGPNRFGELSDGYLTLRGRLIPATFGYTANDNSSSMSLRDSNGNKLNFNLHSDGGDGQIHLVPTPETLQGRTFWWSESQHDEQPVPVACLKVIGEEFGTGLRVDYYLLLVRSELMADAYERVGLLDTYYWADEDDVGHGLSLWSNAIEQDVTIV